MGVESVTCKKCKGAGKIRRDECATCKGSGQVKVTVINNGDGAGTRTDVQPVKR